MCSWKACDSCSAMDQVRTLSLLWDMELQLTFPSTMSSTPGYPHSWLVFVTAGSDVIAVLAMSI